MTKNLKSLLNGENTLKSATFILIITLALSNILGVIRDHYLAQKIQTDILDIYYAAFRLPDFIFNLLILGAITAAFIPVFSQYKAQKNLKEAWYITNAVMTSGILILIFVALILFFIMPFLMKLVVPDFTPEKQLQTILLARLMLLTPIFFGISYILGGILNSFKRFFIFSLTPLVYNTSIILATLFLAEKYSVLGVTFGVVIGSFLHMAIQIPQTVSLGYRFRLILDWTHKGVRKIFKLMIPRTIGLGANQLMLIVFTAIASMVPGSIAIFNLANNIQTVPSVVFASSLATAIFPTLAEKYSLGLKKEFARYIFLSLRWLIYILIPSTFGIILLRAQIIRLILGSGFFGWEQTAISAATLGWFIISLLPQGVILILARAYYAFHDTKNPTIYSIISFIISIIFGFLLVRTRLDVAPALATAFSIGCFINAFLLFLFLKKRIEIPIGELIWFSLKILLASLIMSVVIQATKIILAEIVDMQRFWGVLVQSMGAILIGGGIFLGTAWVLGCQESLSLIKMIFLRKNNVIKQEVLK